MVKATPFCPNLPFLPSRETSRIRMTRRGRWSHNGRPIPLSEIKTYLLKTTVVALKERAWKDLALKGKAWEDLHPVSQDTTSHVPRPVWDVEDKWVWMYSPRGGEGFGDVYDGYWKDFEGSFVEHDTNGVMHNSDDDHCGLMHRGSYKNGLMRGQGRSWW